ncbi:NUDIX domain-containing protein [Bacillus stercoris]|nr:NUDIX domain-containing protein [Bacillus stercoris]
MLSRHLDFSLTELGIQKREYLGRYEYIPAQKEGLSLCSLTGGYDKSEESFKECAIRELEEEGGLSVIDSSKVIDLGIVRNSKSSDNVMHLFAVNHKYCKEVQATGDGTIAEQGSYVKWISEKEAVFCEDVLLPTMIQRLNLNSL